MRGAWTDPVSSPLSSCCLRAAKPALEGGGWFGCSGTRRFALLDTIWSGPSSSVRRSPGVDHDRAAEVLRDGGPMLTFLLWIILFVIAWPVAILALILYPIAWLLAVPFRLVGISVRAVFDFLGALLGLPARVLGGRPVSG